MNYTRQSLFSFNFTTQTVLKRKRSYTIGLSGNPTQRDRKAWNEQAIRTLQELQNRHLTLSDELTLSRYSGQGAIGASFSEYYTLPEVAQAIWETLNKLGLSGQVLEPSCGTGVLMQHHPDNVTFTAVEYDRISSEVSRILFPGHEVVNTTFEHWSRSNSKRLFDGVVGNPPFGPRMVSGLFDKPHIKEAARYFSVTALDHLREGGLAALILPHGILRSQTARDYRLKILARAEVIAVHGLPSSAFTHAGAEFASVDIWFLRGRERHARIALEALGEPIFRMLGEHTEFLDGKYHQCHPELLHAVETTRVGNAGRDLYYREGSVTPELLQKIPLLTPMPSQEITCYSLRRLLENKGRPDMTARMDLALRQAEQIEDGEVRFQGEQAEIYFGRWIKTTQEDIHVVRDAVRINDLLKVHAWVMAERDFETADHLRALLANTLTEFRDRHGNPHKNKTLSSVGRVSGRLNHVLCAFKVHGDIEELYQHSYQRPIVDYDATNFASIIRHVRSLGEKSTAEKILAATFMYSSVSEVQEALFEEGYCLTSSGAWRTSGEYFQGSGMQREQELKAKLFDLEPDSFEHRVYSRQLEQVKARTVRKTLEELEIYPTNPKVPLDILEKYLETLEFKGYKPKGMLDLVRDGFGQLQVDINPYADKEQQRTCNALKRFLTGKGMRGDEQDLYTEWNDNFKSYLIEHDHRETMEDLFNETASFITPEWSREAIHLAIPGWNRDMHPHWWQHEAVNRALDQGNSICALSVGLGKTLVGVLLASKAKQDGLCRKPVIVVPKSVMGNWRKEFLRAKPAAKLLMIGAAPVRDDQGRTLLDQDGQEVWQEVTGQVELDRQLTQMKMYLWDAVIMTIDTFTRIPMPDDRLLEVIEKEFQVQEGSVYARPGNMDSGHYNLYQRHKVSMLLEQGQVSLEELEGAAKRVRELDEALRALNAMDILNQEQKQDVERKKSERTRASFFAKGFSLLSAAAHSLQTPFTELGVDFLIVDEAHRFSNIWTFDKGRTTIKYLGAAGNAAQRALDLYYKSRHMFTVTGGTGLHLLTATPLRNSPIELYNMVSLVAQHLWASVGVRHVADFVDRFCEIEERTYYDTDKEQDVSETVLLGLKNLHELRQLTRQIINRKTAEEVGLPLPRKDVEFRMINPTEVQSRLLMQVLDNPVQSLQLFMRSNVTEETLDDHRLALLHLLKRIELDLEMLNHEGYKGYVSPKVEAMLQDLEKDIAGGEKVVIFCDSKDMPVTAKADRPNINGYSFHSKLKNLIVERTGLRADEIGIINATTCPGSEDRLRVSTDFNAGRLRVVIGNRETMSEGVNLQVGVRRLYCLDVPINPMRLEQQDGRAVRQGNKSDSVMVRYYLGTRGLDKDILDILWGKTGWYDAFWNGEADTIESASQAVIPNREKLMALRIEDETERQAALDLINLSEKEKELQQKRRQAYKTFKNLQLTARSLQRLELQIKGGVEQADDLRVQKQLGYLEDKVQGYQDRLLVDESFSGHLGVLDAPLEVLIHHRSSMELRMGQMVFFRNTHEDTKQNLFTVKSIDVTQERLVLTGHESGSRDRTVTLNARSSYVFEPATEDRLMEWLVRQSSDVSMGRLRTYGISKETYVAHLAARFRGGNTPLLVERQGRFVVLEKGSEVFEGDLLVTPYTHKPEQVQSVLADHGVMFRMLRELDLPEEHLESLSRYQLASLALSEARLPLTHLSQQGYRLRLDWRQGLEVLAS